MAQQRNLAAEHDLAAALANNTVIDARAMRAEIRANELDKRISDLKVELEYGRVELARCHDDLDMAILRGAQDAEHSRSDAHATSTQLAAALVDLAIAQTTAEGLRALVAERNEPKKTKRSRTATTDQPGDAVKQNGLPFT